MPATISPLFARSVRAMARGLVAAALAAGAAQAHAQAARYVDAATGLRFPERLSHMAFVRVVEYENKDNGYCVMYAAATAHGQLCVYDLGHRDLPTGVDHPAFKAALQMAVDGTVAMANRPPLRGGQEFAHASPEIEGGGKVARLEVRLFRSVTDLPDGKTDANIHLVAMTTGLSKFIKLNYTGRNMESAAFATDTRQVVEDFVGYNLPLLEKLLVPAP